MPLKHRRHNMHTTQEFRTDKLHAVVQNGILTELYELGDEETSLVIPGGTTGAAVYTLRDDDITKMESEKAETYHLRNAVTDHGIVRKRNTA